MITVKTPFRISFFGGGTDYYDYFSQYGGAVLSTTMDKYCYVTLRDLPPLFDYQNQFTYSKIERFNVPDEVSHPLVRNALKFLSYDHIQISYDADLPACSGLGTSSAFAVALLQGLHAMRGEYPDKESLAKEAVHLERELCAEAGGVQDQYATAFGGFNRFSFTAEGVTVQPVNISALTKAQLEKNLMLVFTGFTRYSDAIAAENQLNIARNVATLHKMAALVDEGEKLLQQGNLDDFGRLLGETWHMKQTLAANTSNETVNEIYRSALANGALGGKLLGAGGGGYLLLYVPKQAQAGLRNALEPFQFAPFAFENGGTQIMENTQS
ncbi:MAG: kinase [Clostridia bacterium]|nr:kinase [Clostridia bacterium]